MNELSFRELAKMIHPDLNPNVTNAGSKMAEAVKNKSNPSILYRKAIEWGLIKDESARFTSSNNTYNSYNTYTASETEVFVDVSNIVKIVKKRSSIKGCVVDIKTVKKGSRKGWYKFFIVTDDGRIFSSDRPNKKSTNNFYSDGQVCVEFNYYNKYYTDYLNRKREEKRRKKEEKRYHDEQVSRRLIPNYDYSLRDVYITHKNGMEYKVIRTKKKRVVFWDYTEHKERACNFSSIKSVYEYNF